MVTNGGVGELAVRDVVRRVQRGLDGAERLVPAGAVLSSSPDPLTRQKEPSVTSMLTWAGQLSRTSRWW